VHPVTGRNMLIEAVEGLGEALVSGQRTPNRYVVDDDQTVVERSESFDLDDDVIHELARFGRDVAAALEQPADIEFAIARGSIYLLQARPITTVAGDP
jgi:phosphoenolpyruvate synthase/pyruvate phosphate dikinase